MPVLRALYHARMRAITVLKPVASAAASAQVKLVSDWPEPAAPGPGHAQVRTLASALNHLDLWVVRGVPGLELEYPRISGSDGCGVVERIGAGVDQSWLGRRVVLNAAMARPNSARPDDGPGSTLAPEYELLGEHHHGTMAERFNAPVCNLQPVADGLDPCEAAAFGLTFLTAYSMVVTKARVRAGQWVLVTGIGGGVAVAALMLARHAGCRVIVTSRHQWKLDRAKELGADVAILDQGQDWSKQVREATAKRGVDVAVDSSGKATHIKCIKSLARGGAYVTPGCTSGPDAVTDLARIFWNQLRILGSTMGTPDEFAEVVALYRAGHVRPIVDQVYTPDRCGEAYTRLEAGEQFGKLVVNWS